MWKVYTIFITLNCIVFINADKGKDFGTFNLSMNSFTSCKGPKQRDCTISKIDIIGPNLLKYDFRVLKNTTPTKGKIVAQKDGVEFLRFQMKKPCDHLFFRPLFQSIMNITKDCVVLKGRYEFTVDVKKIAEKYWAGSFLFGDWTFKSVFYNDECNFHCSISVSTIFANQ